MGQQFNYTISIDAEITKIKTKMETLQASFQKFGDTSKNKNFEKSFEGIGKALTKLQEKASVPITSEATFGSMLKDSAAISSKLKELESVLDKVAEASKSERFEFLPPETQKQIEGITSAIQTFSTAIEQSKKKTDEHIAKERELNKVLREKEELEKKISKNTSIQQTAQKAIPILGKEITKIQDRLKVLGSEEEVLQRLAIARKAYDQALEDGDSRAFAMVTSGLGDVQRELNEVQELTQALKQKEEAYSAAEKTSSRYSKSLQSDSLHLKGLEAQANALTEEINELNTALKNGSSKQQTAAWKALRKSAEELGVSLDGIPVRRSQKAIDELLGRLKALEEQGYEELSEQIQQYRLECQNVEQINDQLTLSIQQNNAAFNEQKQIMADRTAFLQRIRDFVGLEGAANVARRALNDAMTAVKDLDAVMSQMAMVTEADIGDYWDQLPEHTKRASELGVAIKEVYEAETLYLQQGLSAEKTTAMASETLKMAKIANLDAATATDRMTAALRGFNMELNEISATKVSDVYSELAAITAADVKEISSAMSKTASIASSAGMEFETTAAFLSQIIETTRESAETAGTALKTVIARFQELKKDPAEIGEVDGEIVDANKIETALRSVGVSLRDSRGQFRALDDVFMELSSKWNTLDVNTQRYIATIAAGSRQQSRFIAMMSDYGRTQQLVEAATNSSGASQAQYEKTLDSLESKLKQLANAWDTFTTGLLNQDVIKFGVDMLVKLLEFVNKLTEGFGGLTGTISKLGLLVGAFKLGQKLISKFSNNFINTFKKAGLEAGQGLVAGWKSGLDQIKKDTKNAGKEIGEAAYAARNENTKIAEDGHIKGFREQVFAPVMQKTATAQVRSTTSQALSSADASTGLKEAVSNQTIEKGTLTGLKGQKIEAQGFTQTFGPETIKAIENQFITSMTSMGVKIENATASWKEFESEMGSLDAISGIEKLDAKLSSVADKVKDTSKQVRQISVGSGEGSIAQAAQIDGQKEPLKNRIGSVLAEKTGISAAAEASRAKKANKAMSQNRGKSMKKTIETLNIKPKLDGKALAAVEAQFKAKMTAMKQKPKEIDAAWSELEKNIGDKDIVTALSLIDAKLGEVAAETKTADESMGEIQNTTETTGAMGEKSLEGTKESLESVSNAASAVGGAMMGVGSVFTAVGGAFRSLGLDAIADAFETVGQIIMFVGSALMLIPPIISIINLALSTPPIGIIMLIIGAIIIGLTLIIALISSIAKSNSAAEKLKAVNEAANEAKETAKATKEAYDELLEYKSEYDGLTKTIDELTEGTTAWKNATKELGEVIMNLVEKYPQLAKYVNWDKGYLDISAEGWDHILEQQAQAVTNAQTIAAQRQKDVYSMPRDTVKDQLDYQVDYMASFKSSDGTSMYNVFDDVRTALESFGIESKEYQEAVIQLKKYVAEGTITNTQADNLLAKAEEYSQIQEKVTAAEQQIYRASGSMAAQADASYNAIINSLEGTYDDAYGTIENPNRANQARFRYNESGENTALNRANKKMGGRGKGDNNFFSTTGNDSSKQLKELMAEAGLDSSGVETYDMAKLLKAKTGKEYTQDEIDKLGNKKAKKEMAKELQAAYAAEELGDVVNELYELQKVNQDVKEMYSGSLDVSILSDSEIDQMNNISDTAKQALKNQAKTIEQGRKDIDKELQKIYSDETLEAQAFAGGYDAAQRFINTYNSMLNGAGGELAKSFKNMFKGLDTEAQTDFFDKYGEVNWSSSIEGAAALKQALEDDNVAIRVFAQSSLELESAFYSATSQANEMYHALGEDTILELAQDGKIAATEILELAKTNDKLATMLENTGVSASTLGRYYELLEDGTLNAASATDDFIRVLETLNGAVSSIEDSFAFIDTWEPARSSTEISATFSDMRDEMFELYNSGAFGDEALEDYIEAFIGAEKWEALVEEKGGDVRAAMEQVMVQVQEFDGNFKSIWQNLANSGAIEGITVGEEGNILFDFEKLGSTGEMKEKIMKQGWSEEMADALIADAQTFGLNVKNGLKEINIQEAFIDWLSTSVKNVGGAKIIDESQFKAFMEESGLDPKIAKEALKKQGIEVQSALDDAGNLNTWVRESILGDARETETFDIQETYQLMIDLGLNDTAAKKQVAALAEELEDVPFTLNDETVKEAGAELGTITYQGQNYGSTMALIDAVENEKVLAAQKKAALDQATMSGEAMAVASVSASTAGTKTMAIALENVINGVVDTINNIFGWTGLKLNKFYGLSNGVDAMVQNQTNAAIDSIHKYYAKDYAEVNATLNSEEEGIDKTEAQNIYENIKNDSSTFTPTTGSAYEKADKVETPAEKEAAKDETSYDWLFILNQELEDSMRKRAKAERAYQKALENENTLAIKLVATRKKLVETIQDEIKDQEAIIKGAKNKQEELLAEIQNDNELKGLEKYIKVDKLTGEFTLSKDYESADLDQETRKKYDEYIAKFLENEQTIKDAEDAIEDNTDQLKEIDKKGRAANQDIYDRTYEALVSERQQEIDKLTTINDSIQEAADILVSKIQEQIDDARQARQNEKIEQEIADKETRLAYLMMDTSGGNEVEIANLQKEIADSKENYTDSLVDQSLQELSDANAKAAEQRQQQIDIMTAQLEAYSKSSEIWNEVGQLVNESYEAMKKGIAWEDTELGKLLHKAEVEEPNLNPYAEEKWKEETGEVVNEAFAYKESKEDYKPTSEVYELEPSVVLTSSYTAASNTNLFMPRVTNDDEKNLIHGEAPKLIYDVGFKDNTSALIKPVGPGGGGSSGVKPNLPEMPKQVIFKYKDGGLADFTGPAWLDGTKSKPEMVLNQTDTANFIQLKDILADILHGTSTVGKTDKENKGDNYYDIEINVEKIEDDYDVEQLAEKIRTLIYEDSVYRNVNLVNNIH